MLTTIFLSDIIENTDFLIILEVNKLENIIVTHAKRSPDFEMSETHAHEEYEIYYLAAGQCRFFIHDRLYDLQKGDFAMLKSGVFHKSSGIGTENIQKIDIYLSSSQLEKLFGDHVSKILSVFNITHIVSGTGIDVTVRTVMRKIENESENDDEFKNIMIENYVRELLIVLFRYVNSSDYPKSIHKNTVTEKAAHFIVKNYQNNISLEDVSRYVHLSPEYFSKKFKQDTGIGFREYLIKIRLQHAVKLLLTTDMSITEIAFSCGFNSSNYFSNTFTKNIGMPPLRYRAQL